MTTFQDRHFWYIVAETTELTPTSVLSRKILDQSLVCYRDSNGKPVILPDRCMHRCGKLSKGKVSEGKLACPYHGWVYGAEGKVVSIPSEGACHSSHLKHQHFATREQDGYIYVCLESHPEVLHPYSMPHFQEKGWRNIRLQHFFKNNVTNCVENFIDVPHTAFVHAGIFRSIKKQPLTARVKRTQGTVLIDYQNEDSNLGSLSWILNPSKGKIVHRDHFIMPNITHVIYRLPSGWEYLITSQSIPVSDFETRVYTDITYSFGFATPFAAWIVKRQAKKVIAQDMQILEEQMEVIKKEGTHFINMPCDIVHVYISEIRKALSEGRDPRLLPDKEREIHFYV